MNLMTNNNSSNRTRNLGKAVALAVLMAAGFAATNAMADHGFGQIGSAGTVDEKDLGIYEAKGPTMSIKSNAPSRTTLNVRYNIVNVDGLRAAEGSNHYWRIRFKDNGDDARVILKLKYYDLTIGEIVTLWTFDSNDYAPTGGVGGYGYVTMLDTSGSWQFDFGEGIYYVDAIIKQRSADAEAGLSGFYLSNY